jgi:spindle assembly abnormal protein 6
MNEPPESGKAASLVTAKNQGGAAERLEPWQGRYEQRVPVTVRCVRTGSERTLVPLCVQLRALGEGTVSSEDALAARWVSAERFGQEGVSGTTGGEPSLGGRSSRTGLSAVRALQLRVTDPADPLFLYEWHMAEEDYPHFKADQCLFVDFGRFPRTFVDLLEQCCRDTSGFHALLRIEDGVARLSIFETTAFRNLPHLTLELHVASEERLRQYLVSGLRQAEQQAVYLQDTLNQTRQLLEERTNRVDELMGQVAQLQQERSRALDAIRAQHQAELAEAREQALKEALQKQETWQQERRMLEERHRAEVASVTERLHQAESDLQRLADERYAREQQIRQLEMRLSAQQTEYDAMRSELERSREEHRERARHVHELERQLDTANMQLQNLERALQDKDDWMERMRQMLELATAQKTTLEETILAHREARARLERQLDAAAAEIERGNGMLERLQAALREAKAKARLKAAVAEQQETLLRERQREIDILREELAALTTHGRPWRAHGAHQEATSQSATSGVSAP